MKNGGHLKKFFVVSLLFVSFALLSCIPSQAQQIDNFVTCAPYFDSCTLTANQAWSSSNLDWRFPLYYPGGNIRIYITNHNPTNGHTLTPKLWATADVNTSTTLLNNADKWVQVAVSNNSITNAQCASLAAANTTTPGASGTGTCYAVGLHARQVAFQITGAATAAGSPDTFDINVVESPYQISGAQVGQDDSASNDPCGNPADRINLSNTRSSGSVYGNVVFVPATKTMFLCAVYATISQGSAAGATLNFGTDGTTSCTNSAGFVSVINQGGAMVASTSLWTVSGTGVTTFQQLPVGQGLCSQAVAGTAGGTQFNIIYVLK